jgi:predicted TIM-barrel fold metal-dependent hydrolase
VPDPTHHLEPTDGGEEAFVLRDDLQIISVDDHVIEHPNVWLDRLPAKWREQAPHIEHAASGSDYWIYEGKRAGNFALNAVAGKDPQDFGLDPRSYQDMIPGCYQISDRIKDMDLEGVHAQLCFANMPGFAGRVFWQSDDKELGAACVQAYNDFIIDEWCAYNSDRQIPLVLIPFWDVDASIAELHRTVAKGARSVSFVEAPHRLGLPSFHTTHWDPLFAAIQEADVPISVHFGSGGGAGYNPPDADHHVEVAMMGMNSMAACIDLMMSRVLHAFPALKFVLAEGGIGWVPYVLERCDYTWERHRWYTSLNKDVRPSELFHRNIFGCFISDRFGMENRHLIGLDNIMFESDYPHSDSNWPHTRKLLAEALTDVPDAEAAQMMEGNARRLFKFPRHA